MIIKALLNHGEITEKSLKTTQYMRKRKQK